MDLLPFVQRKSTVRDGRMVGGGAASEDPMLTFYSTVAACRSKMLFDLSALVGSKRRQAITREDVSDVAAALHLCRQHWAQLDGVLALPGAMQSSTVLNENKQLRDALLESEGIVSELSQMLFSKSTLGTMARGASRWLAVDATEGEESARNGPLPLATTERLSQLRDGVRSLQAELYAISHKKEFGPPPGTWLGDANHNNTINETTMTTINNTLSADGGEKAQGSDDWHDLSIEVLCRLAEDKQLQATRHVLMRRIQNNDLGGVDVQEALREMSQDLQVQLSRTARQLENERHNAIMASKAHHEELMKVEARHESIVGEMRRRHVIAVDRLQTAITTQQNASIANASQVWENIMIEYASRLSGYRGSDLTRATAMESLKEVLMSERSKVEGIYEVPDIDMEMEELIEEDVRRRREDEQQRLESPSPHHGDASPEGYSSDAFPSDDPHSVWCPTAANHSSVLARLVRGKQAELNIVLAGHRAALRVKGLEWETHQRDVIAKYEAMIAHLKGTSPQAVMDELKSRVTVLTSELEDLRGKYALILKENLSRAVDAELLEEGVGFRVGCDAAAQRGALVSVSTASLAVGCARGAVADKSCQVSMGSIASSGGLIGGLNTDDDAPPDEAVVKGRSDQGRRPVVLGCSCGRLVCEDIKGARGASIAYTAAEFAAIVAQGAAGHSRVDGSSSLCSPGDAGPSTGCGVGSLRGTFSQQGNVFGDSPAESESPLAVGSGQGLGGGSSMGIRVPNLHTAESLALLASWGCHNVPPLVVTEGSEVGAAMGCAGSSVGLSDGVANAIHTARLLTVPNGECHPSSAGSCESAERGCTADNDAHDLAGLVDSSTLTGGVLMCAPTGAYQPPLATPSLTEANAHGAPREVGDDPFGAASGGASRGAAPPEKGELVQKGTAVGVQGSGRGIASGSSAASPCLESGTSFADGRGGDSLGDPAGRLLFHKCGGGSRGVPSPTSGNGDDGLYVKLPATKGMYIKEVLPSIPPPMSLSDAMPRLMGEERFYTSLCRSAALLSLGSTAHLRPGSSASASPYSSRGGDPYTRQIRPFAPNHCLEEARRMPIRPVTFVEVVAMLHNCVAMTSSLVASSAGVAGCASLLVALQRGVDHLRQSSTAHGVPMSLGAVPFDVVLGYLGDPGSDPTVSPVVLDMLFNTLVEIVRLWHEVQVASSPPEDAFNVRLRPRASPEAISPRPPMLTASNRSVGRLVTDRPGSARYIQQLVAAQQVREGAVQLRSTRPGSLSVVGARGASSPRVPKGPPARR